ncbi:unnamed protein product [Paramecium primaurelia]|uniref:Uncharacterized protein n=1 Tax=Paramecium primaurelia TaxID=5886 RepID=A0A8S1NNC1_PARPR|nr:unnamed protein product [Paramecium primaurelia]
MQELQEFLDKQKDLNFKMLEDMLSSQSLQIHNLSMGLKSFQHSLENFQQKHRSRNKNLFKLYSNDEANIFIHLEKEIQNLYCKSDFTLSISLRDYSGNLTKNEEYTVYIKLYPIPLMKIFSRQISQRNYCQFPRKASFGWKDQIIIKRKRRIQKTIDHRIIIKFSFRQICFSFIFQFTRCLIFNTRKYSGIKEKMKKNIFFQQNQSMDHETFFLKAVTQCYKCWELNPESSCYATCANEYLIYKKGLQLIQNENKICLETCQNDNKCIKKCESELNTNQKSLLKLLNRIQPK